MSDAVGGQAEAVLWHSSTHVFALCFAVPGQQQPLRFDPGNTKNVK